jgi:hypothetical protein
MGGKEDVSTALPRASARSEGLMPDLVDQIQDSGENEDIVTMQTKADERGEIRVLATSRVGTRALGAR